MEIGVADPGLANSIMKTNKWGNEHERSLLIIAEERPNLEAAMKGLGSEGIVKRKEKTDVKDLVGASVATSSSIKPQRL